MKTTIINRYECTYVCMYVCMFVCMYIGLCTECMYVCMQTHRYKIDNMNCVATLAQNNKSLLINDI